jgi:hypothetical protein
MIKIKIKINDKEYYLTGLSYRYDNKKFPKFIVNLKVVDSGNLGEIFVEDLQRDADEGKVTILANT